ncbi:MAG: thioredoxin family protein [Deltaproteobacteria bacterium]|nr:thioredoxin family protein [Deltaproteobacteria bacterium]
MPEKFAGKRTAPRGLARPKVGPIVRQERLLGTILPWMFFTLPLFAALFFAPGGTARAGSPTVSVKVVHSRDRYPAGGTYPIQFRIRVADDWYLHGPQKGKEALVPTTLSFSGTPGLAVAAIRFPASQKIRFPYTRAPVEVFSGTFLVRAVLEIARDAPIRSGKITGRLTYQACSAVACLPPEEVTFAFDVSVARAGAKSALLNRKSFEDSGSAPEAGPGPFSPGSGFWLTLLGLLVGGLALNLTPCVYPLIPITVSYFAGQGAGPGARRILHGGLYLCGLAVTNSLLGVTAALSGGLLGAALQSPLVLGLVAAILLALATSFFGLWEIRVPRGLMRAASRNIGGYTGTFFIGLTLGIVAAPCLGPFVLGLLTYVGQRGDPFVGFAYFFVLSIGMGLPLAALGVFSSAVDRLPVSGEWMVWVRKCFGWVLVAMAGYVLMPLVSSPGGRAAVWAVTAAAAGLHLGWVDRSRAAWGGFSTLKKVVGGALIAGAFFLVLYPASTGNGLRWVPYSETALRQARDRRMPVLLDFYAEWCGPCKVLEREVFHDPDVVRLADELMPVRVDLTTRHPGQEKLIKQYSIRGVPTLIFLDRDGVEQRALRVEELVSRRVVLERMKRIIAKQ